MNKSLIPVLLGVLILIIAGAALWFFFLREEPVELPTGDVIPAAPNPAVNRPVPITDNGTYHEISAEYPEMTPLRTSAGATADAQAVATMKTYVETNIARFKVDSGLSELTQEDIEMWGLGGDRKFALEMEYEVFTGVGTVTYVYTVYEDTLGAHPNGYYRTFTFDSKTGAELTLADLFAPGSNYLSVLSEESRTQIIDSVGDYIDRDYLESGTEPKAENFQNFYLTEKTLVLIFPPYQVGPYAAGTQHAWLEKATLTDFKAEYK